MRNFWLGLRNLRAWFEIVWNHRNWDYDYTFVLLRKSLSGLEKGLREGVGVHHPHHMRGLRMCILLLDRLIDDDYDDHNPFTGKLDIVRFEKVRDYDCKLLFHTVGRYSRCWWD